MVLDISLAGSTVSSVDGRRSFIFWTNSGLFKRGLITSPVIPEERSIEGSLLEEGTLIPERTDCRSINCIGTFPDAPAVPSEDAVFGREEDVVDSSDAVAGTGAAVVGEFPVLSRVLVVEELLLDLFDNSPELANPPSPPLNNWTNCCWLIFPSNDWSSPSPNDDKSTGPPPPSAA